MAEGTPPAHANSSTGVEKRLTPLSDKELEAAFGATVRSYRAAPDEHSTYLLNSTAIKNTSIFAFPGSRNICDWMMNSDFRQTAASKAEGLQPHCAGLKGHLHKGFASRLAVIRKESSFEAELSSALNRGDRIIFTGHSLGGAVATLATLMVLNRARICEGGSSTVNVVCCTFGAPLVGDAELCDSVEAHGWRECFLHIVWRHDIVPRLLLSPFSVFTKAGVLLSNFAMRGLQALLTNLPEPPADSLAANPILDTARGRERAELSLESRQKAVSREDWAALSELGPKVRDGCGSAAARMDKGKRVKEVEAEEDKEDKVAGGEGCMGRFWQCWQKTSHVTTALHNLRNGFIDPRTYRPFGLYLLQTSSGSKVYSEPKKVLQMLYVTMVTPSGCVSTHPLDVVDEHHKDSYKASVDMIIARGALSKPDPGYITSEIRTLMDDHLVDGLQTLDQKQDATLQKLDNLTAELHTGPQSWRAVQKSMDVIYAYRLRHHEAGADYCEAFEANKCRKDSEVDEVESARRVLRDFWEQICSLWRSGRLQAEYPEVGECVWLTRALQYINLVEPLEIANYYRCENWKVWPVGERHYCEAGNRPERFKFLEARLGVWNKEPTAALVLKRMRLECDAMKRVELSAAA